MKFIILSIIVNWSAAKYGSKIERKDLIIKASQVTSVVGTEYSEKTKDDGYYVACKIEVDEYQKNRQVYYVENPCSQVVEEVNKGLSK